MDYWQKQDPDAPLFPDIEWSKPEQRSQAGKLLIVGGSTHGFTAVVKSYSVAVEAGVGSVKVAVPDGLKRNLPADFGDGVFLPTNPSGALSKNGEAGLIAAGQWADGILLVGDSGQNSETAILYDKLLDATDAWATITRDAVELLYTSAEKLANRPHTNLVMNFPQVQKLFSKVYYPKILTFSMQFMSFVEAVRKFTITYPVTLTVLFGGKIIVAHGGQVVSQDFSDQTSLINGTLAAKAAAYLLWSPQKPLQAIATSWQN
jgi:NAD(P)H-hydrate repair Nnr-like enzyme with NAD(P)H-hydrate dehydratase domain